MSTTFNQSVSARAPKWRVAVGQAGESSVRVDAGTLTAVHTTSYVRNTASGTSYSVPRLCQALAELGVNTSLHALAPSYFPDDASYGCEQHAVSSIVRRLGGSPAMNRRLREVCRTADVIHNHNLWQMSNVYPHWASRHSRCRLVQSPRGTLSPVALQISWLRKRVMWWLAQRAAVRNSDCIHATSEAEYRDFRRCGLRAPVAVIPNAIHLPDMSREQRRTSTGRRRLLFLARIHPIKGVDVLLRSWRQVEADFPDWELHIAGPSDPPHYLQSMERLTRELGLQRVTFPGPAYGLEKTAMYRNSDLYVLPTHSENFGITVAEALAHGVPAITTRGAPWAGLEQHRCGWWIEGGEQPLTDCLRDVLVMSHSELHERGGRGREWMERNFSWSRVGEMMRDTYLWLVGGGSPPDWVRVDG